MAESDDDLLEAISERDSDGVRAALAAGADPNGPRDADADGYLVDPPIYCAAASGSAELVRILLAAGADPTTPGWERALAATATSAEALTALLEAGADPDPPVTGPAESDGDPFPDDRRGFYSAPVGYEIASNPEVDAHERVRMLRVLVARGVRLDGPTGAHSALDVAARAADLDALAVLFEAGADPLATPGLLAAVCWGDDNPNSGAVIDLLVAAGCDVEAENGYGFRPLQLALQPYDEDLGTGVSIGFQPEAAIALLRHGASVDIRVPDGRRPLHVAVAERQPDVVAALLAAGADPTEPDADGRSALALAAHLVDEAERTLAAATGTSSADQATQYWVGGFHLPAARRCLEVLTEATAR